MPLPIRRSDDADVIRDRLRRLLADADGVGGWVPEDDPQLQGADQELVPARVVPTLDREDDEGLPAGIGRHRSPGPTVRWNPGRAGARSIVAAGLAAALTLLGWTWHDRPRIEPAPSTSSSPSSAQPPAAPAGQVVEPGAVGTPEPVVVSVVGRVARPGLVTLPAGSRVADAVEAAGGLLPDSDPAAINLAAVISDGQQIAVGVPGASSAGDQPAAPEGAGGPVNLNTASAAQLDELPGIGAVLAQRIVEHRTHAGPFRSVDELDDVPGIGPSIAAELAELVTV